jgi:hypothetical protein
MVACPPGWPDLACPAPSQPHLAERRPSRAPGSRQAALIMPGRYGRLLVGVPIAASRSFLEAAPPLSARQRQDLPCNPLFEGLMTSCYTPLPAHIPVQRSLLTSLPPAGCGSQSIADCRLSAANSMCRVPQHKAHRKAACCPKRGLSKADSLSSPGSLLRGDAYYHCGLMPLHVNVLLSGFPGCACPAWAAFPRSPWRWVDEASSLAPGSPLMSQAMPSPTAPGAQNLMPRVWLAQVGEGAVRATGFLLAGACMA